MLTSSDIRHYPIISHVYFRLATMYELFCHRFEIISTHHYKINFSDTNVKCEIGY